MDIVAKESLAPKIVRLDVLAPDIAAKAEPGHFVIVRLHARAERIPLTIADFDRDRGTITLVVQDVGHSTAGICKLEPGCAIQDVLGPLGTSLAMHEPGTVLAVAGGLGAAPLYPKMRALFAAGNRVVALHGARSRDLLVFSDALRRNCHQYLVATDDGSMGHHGFVTDLLRQTLRREHVDEVIAIGPAAMMEACCTITRELQIRTTVSLNPLMVDGTGMCGGCRVTVGGVSRFCCVDGPLFDGLAVDFAELRQRQRYYAGLEKIAYSLGERGSERPCRAS